MKKTLTVISFLAMLFIGSNAFSQYLTEGFESAFTGSPAAPPGWTQSQVVLIGDGVAEPISTNGEKDWEQNTWTGSAWSKSPSTPGTVPSGGAFAGTGVLWFNDIFFPVATANGSRRVETPTINLAASVSPYVRFYMFSAQLTTNVNFRVMASSDGGTTWKAIMIVLQNAAVTGTMAATDPYQRINVLIPAAYRTANCKIGLEVAAVGGTSSFNLFIDNFSVEEYTPSTITANVTTGLWSAPATWVGGVVPTSDNDVVIPVGATVNMDVNACRMQNVTVAGTLQYGTTTATHLTQIFGNLTVSVGGLYNSWNTTTGKRTFIGGNINCAGSIDFSVGAGLIVWCGGAPATYTNTGTVVGGRCSNVWHYNSGGVTYNSPLTVPNTVDLGNGVVNPNGNLTVGSGAYALTQTIERTSQGSFSQAPIWGTGVTRSIAYFSASVAPYTKSTITPGFEVETINGERCISGTLTMSTYDHLTLGFPLVVGTPSSGVLTMTRGLIISSVSNTLILNVATTGSAGTAPSTATPPTTHGSYVVGPVQKRFPGGSNTTAINIPLGSGSNYNGSTPSTNTLRTVTYSTTSISWTGSVITTSMVNSAPSGSVNSPLTAMMGIRGYQCTLNSGAELPTSAVITFNWGADDALSGAVADIRVAQAPAMTGTWTERTITSTSGSLTSGSRGTVAGVTLTGNPYFAFGTATTAATMTYVSSKGFLPLSTPILRNSSPTNQVIIGAQIITGGSAATPINVTAMGFNVGFSPPADINNAKVFYTTTPTFATTTQYGATIPSPQGGISFSGNQALVLGANYFWLTYDVSNAATVGHVLNGQIPNIVMDGGVGTVTPSVVTPSGYRPIYDNNYGGGAPYNANYYYANTLAGLPGAQQPTYNWINPSGHTSITDAQWKPNTPIVTSNFGDDAYFGPVTMPFSFSFFGNSYTQLWINTNGWVTFTDPSYLTQAQMRAVASMPTTGGINNYVAGACMDLDMSIANYPGTRVYYDGNTDREVVTFWHAHDYSSTPASNFDSLTFQIVLFADGQVQINYNETETGTPPTAITNACVVGIENIDGSAGLQYRLNGAGGPMFGSPLAVAFGLNQNSLPVELASFSSSVTNNDVKLNWSTVSELNNRGYNIERKLISENSWSNVGFIDGAGTSGIAHSYSFTDRRLSTGKYNYRLRQTDYNGTYKYYDLANEVVVGIPTKFALSQNYPNPFNPTTKIDFELPIDGRVTMKLYDITGREIATMMNNELRTAGYYSAVFNGSNFASGTYFYRLDVEGTNKFSMTKKMMLIK